MTTNITLEGLSLHVADLETSIAFYTRIPGAELEAKRPGAFARIKIGTGSIHLVQITGKNRFHMEFNAEDLTQTHDQLAEAGLAPSKPITHPWGKSDFRITDPDGNVLEFGEFQGD